MVLEVKVPSPGESISEVQLAGWLVSDGDYVEKDQEIAEIDSDKATLTISAQNDGIIKLKILEGEYIEVGTVIAIIEQGSRVNKTKQKKHEAINQEELKPGVEKKKEHKEKMAENDSTTVSISPLAKKILKNNNADITNVVDFFKGLRLTKKDVEYYLENKDKSSIWNDNRETERKKMSTLRIKIANRLVSVKNETAMLTTFNEVNMSAIKKIRASYKDIFKEKHGVSLGFMSFFTKAITEAIYHFPIVNAIFDSDEIVYHRYVDIGIAVSTPKGLIVPVLRNTEQMTLSEIEQKIKEIATKARDNKISLDEMKGGTFTITNGGVFGSMLSTPIINPPQSAILGMHNIVDRPIAVDGKVEIHPMMYVALSYDHRIIDGKDSVSFLVKVKEILEDPVKMLFSGKDPFQSLLGL